MNYIESTIGIRHSLWQAVSSRDIGAKRAERGANSHETTTNVVLSQRTFKDLGDADRVIDLLNNEIGRKIEEANKALGNKEMAKRVVGEYYVNGLLCRLNPN